MQNHCADMPFLVAAGFSLLYPPDWIPAPRLHEDKLRGNDKRECRGAVRLRRMPRVWGCPPIYLFSPQEWGMKGGRRIPWESSELWLGVPEQSQL